MAERIEKYGLRVARSLHDMIEYEALPGTGIAPERFWRGLSELFADDATLEDLTPDDAAARPPRAPRSRAVVSARPLRSAR